MKCAYPEAKFALEVDLLSDGSLLCAEKGRDLWDLLIGAVHYLPISDPALTGSEEIDGIFMEHNRMHASQA
jgi:histidinol phosphatase-like PHP family hydrolase